MRLREYDPPRWLETLMFGVPFGIAMGLSVKLDGEGWFAASWMATSGIPFGLAMAWSSAKWRGDRRRKEAGIPADLLPEARRIASGRSDVPNDPHLRSAAASLAERELAYTKRRRLFRTFLAGVMLFATIAAAVHGSWWAVPYSASLTGVVYDTWITPRRLRQQIERLQSGEQ